MGEQDIWLQSHRPHQIYFFFTFFWLLVPVCYLFITIFKSYMRIFKNCMYIFFYLYGILLMIDNTKQQLNIHVHTYTQQQNGITLLGSFSWSAILRYCLKNKQECIIRLKNSRSALPCVFKPDNTWLRVLWMASKSLI